MPTGAISKNQWIENADIHAGDGKFSVSLPENAPSTVSNALSSSITGIYEIDGRNFGMLDENKLYEGFIRNL